MSLVVLTASSIAYGEENSKMELYKQLIEEGKKEGVPRFNDVTPETIEKLGGFQSGDFGSREKEDQYRLFTDKRDFIRYSGLYPTLDNLIYVMLLDKEDPRGGKSSAFSILNSEYTKLGKDPSQEQLRKHLEDCYKISAMYKARPPDERGSYDGVDNLRAIVEAILLLTKLDKEEGFRHADEFIKDEDVSWYSRIHFLNNMMEFEYTGGYVVLGELAELAKDDTRIKNLLVDMLDYYSEYNGQFATNTEIVINTNQKSKTQIHNEKLELYKQLIEEEEKDGAPPFLYNVTPENIERLNGRTISFADSKNYPKFSFFKEKIWFIKHSNLYPTLDNLIKVALSDENNHIYAGKTFSQIMLLGHNKEPMKQVMKYLDDYHAKKSAFCLLALRVTQLEKDKPSMEQVKQYLENCGNAEFIVSGIPLLTKLDKEEGFRFADKIINDEAVPLEEKTNLVFLMMSFGYTGGYIILNEIAKSDKGSIKSNFPMHMDYYSRYNGQFATNTKIVIDTTTISKVDSEEIESVYEEKQKETSISTGSDTNNNTVVIILFATVAFLAVGGGVVYYIRNSSRK